MSDWEERDNHKYVARVKIKNPKNPKNIYRYFYTQETYKAYLENQQNGQNNIMETISNGKNAISKMLSKLSKENTNKIDDDNRFPKKPDSEIQKTKKILEKLDSKPNGFNRLDKDKMMNKAWEKENAKTLQEWDDKRSAARMKAEEHNKAVIEKEKTEKEKTEKEKTEKEKVEKLLESTGDKRSIDPDVKGNASIGEKVLSKIFPKTTEKIQEINRRDEMGEKYWGYEEANNVVAYILGLNTTRDDYRAAADKLDSKLMPKPYDIDRAMSGVNPNYDPEDYEWSNNCTYCAATYDLRRRGYNVTAAPAEDNIYNNIYNMANTYYGNTKNKLSDGIKDQVKTYDCVSKSTEEKQKVLQKIEDEILKCGDGARGLYTVKWTGVDYGHAMNWEVVDGEVIIIDSQVNKKYKLRDFAERADIFNYYRTDDKRIVAKYSNKAWR